MRISNRVWNNYIRRLRVLNDTAADLVKKYINTHDVSTEDGLARLIAYSYAVATKYGEGSAALAAQMYDVVAELQGALVPAAVPASTASYNTTASTVRGAMLYSTDPNVTASAVARLVKQAGADTTLQNALRDGAQFAWVPHGETCAFCLTLASRGWQYASSKSIKGGHAEHIHNNCDCTYAIRFDDSSDVEGYDPDKYYKWYKSEPGSPDQKMNAMQREIDAKHRDEINARKRAEYARRKENE